MGWGEMAEGEKLVVLLGGGGPGLGCLPFYVGFWRRGGGGLELVDFGDLTVIVCWFLCSLVCELAGFGDFNCDCVLVSLFFSVYNDGIVCSCGLN